MEKRKREEACGAHSESRVREVVTTEGKTRP